MSPLVLTPLLAITRAESSIYLMMRRRVYAFFGVEGVTGVSVEDGTGLEGERTCHHSVEGRTSTTSTPEVYTGVPSRTTHEKKSVQKRKLPYFSQKGEDRRES